MDTTPQFLNDLILTLGVPNGVVNLFASYPYAITFVGLLIGGETVLLPALYLAVIGVLNGWYVMAIMLLATIISDVFWYSVGRGIVPRIIQANVNQKRIIQLNKLSRVIAGKELIILFYSKFIYGTRIAAQILCGARNTSFPSYLIVNTLAVTTLGIVYYALVYLSVAEINALRNVQYKFITMLALVAIVAATIHFIAYTFVKRKWYR